jgi:hypothetical protein
VTIMGWVGWVIARILGTLDDKIELSRGIPPRGVRYVCFTRSEWQIRW